MQIKFYIQTGVISNFSIKACCIHCVPVTFSIVTSSGDTNKGRLGRLWRFGTSISPESNSPLESINTQSDFYNWNPRQFQPGDTGQGSHYRNEKRIWKHLILSTTFYQQKYFGMTLAGGTLVGADIWHLTSDIWHAPLASCLVMWMLFLWAASHLAPALGCPDVFANCSWRSQLIWRTTPPATQSDLLHISHHLHRW